MIFNHFVEVAILKKVINMNEKELNNFKRKYFDLSKRLIKNIVVHDPNTTKEHRKLVFDICEWLLDNDYVFFTRVFTKSGEIIDIVAPDLPHPFIEVRHSESEKKEYVADYDHLRIFVDTEDPHRLL